MAFALLQPMPGYAADAESELQYSVDELRLAIGDWRVVTEFIEARQSPGVSACRECERQRSAGSGNRRTVSGVSGSFDRL